MPDTVACARSLSRISVATSGPLDSSTESSDSSHSCTSNSSILCGLEYASLFMGSDRLSSLRCPFAPPEVRISTPGDFVRGTYPRYKTIEYTATRKCARRRDKAFLNDFGPTVKQGLEINQQLLSSFGNPFDRRHLRDYAPRLRVKNAQVDSATVSNRANLHLHHIIHLHQFPDQKRFAISHPDHLPKVPRQLVHLTLQLVQTKVHLALLFFAGLGTKLRPKRQNRLFPRLILV